MEMSETTLPPTKRRAPVSIIWNKCFFKKHFYLQLQFFYFHTFFGLCVGKFGVLFRTKFHKILHSYSHIFGPQTFSEYPGFMFKAFFESHFCPFKYGFFHYLISLPRKMPDINVGQRFWNLDRLPFDWRNLHFARN